MTSQNTQDLIFKAKFEDDASEDIQSLNDDVENLDSSMGGLSMSAVKAGLGMFGVGVGVQQVIRGASETHKQITATRAMIRLLPESAQSALNDLAPFYDDISRTVGASNLEVEKTAVAITTASGGIAPSIDELQFVYDLMAATGADSAEAAAAVGEALRGNQEPLQNLLGDKYNFHEFNEVMDTLAGTARDAKTPIDDLSTAIKNVHNDLLAAETYGRDFWQPWLNESDEVKEKAQEMKDFLDQLFGRTAGEAGGGGGAYMSPSEIEQEAMMGGIYGVGAAGAGAVATGTKPVSVGITINGDVDSAQRTAVIMRQVEMQIRNIYRGGINTITDSTAFPS